MRKAAIAAIAIAICGAVYSMAQQARGPQDQPPSAKTWEYKVADLDGSGKTDFDSLGKQGWELIAVTPRVMYGPNTEPCPRRRQGIL